MELLDYLWCRVLLQVARFALLAWVGVQAVETLLQCHLQILLIRLCICFRQLLLQYVDLRNTNTNVRKFVKLGVEGMW